MDSPNTIGLALAVIALAGLAVANLAQQFTSRVLEPRCERCSRHHLPACETWGGLR